MQYLFLIKRISYHPLTKYLENSLKNYMRAELWLIHFSLQLFHILFAFTNAFIESRFSFSSKKDSLVRGVVTYFLNLQHIIKTDSCERQNWNWKNMVGVGKKCLIIHSRNYITFSCFSPSFLFSNWMKSLIHM